MKGFGPTSDSLFVAISQCLGGSAACVKIVDEINRVLDKHPDTSHVDNTAFSIPFNPRQVIFHVTWSPDGCTYHVKELETLDLTTSKGYLGLWRRVHNILEWGEKTRFRRTRDALDVIVESDRTAASERARRGARERTAPPFEDSENEDSERAKGGRKLWDVCPQDIV